LFTKGVDGVLNLGAGLDTRPYRMNLPTDLQWFEADYPEMIAFKEDRLKGQSPGCRLERFGLDLANHEARARLLSTVQERCRKVVVLTEGVVPYLSNDEVNDLAKDLHAYDHFEFWIVEYWSKVFMQKMRNRKTYEKLRNAPLKFDPPDWMNFFAETGWNVEQIRHMPIEGRRLGRSAPFPFFLKFLRVFMSQERRKQLAQMFGYALFRARRP
jgi:methyltransferase (TIGR00027 family)